MDKKSQISIFVVIFSIIVIVGMFLVFMSGDSVDVDEYNTGSFYDVESMITSCLDGVVLDGVEHVSNRGGYYESPNKFLFNYGLDIPIYLSQGDEDIPTIKFIENQLSFYVEDNLFDCLDNFSSFKEIGYELEFGEVDVDVSMVDNSISSELDFPITVERNGEVQTFNHFNSNINSDFVEKYLIIIEFIEEQKKDIEFMPLSFLVNFADKNGFIYEYLSNDDGGVVYSFIFDKGNEKYFVYSFGVMYNWGLEE